MIYLDVNNLLLTGYAKVPEKITLAELYSVIVLAIEIDVTTGEILDADCSLVTEVAKNVVKKILVGESIKDIKHIEEKFRVIYHGAVRKALVSTCRICYTKYLKVLHDRSNEGNEEFNQGEIESFGI